jgi:MoxR-like ATPase
MSPTLSADFEARVARALQPRMHSLGLSDALAELSARHATRPVEIRKEEEGGAAVLRLGTASLPLPSHVARPDLVPQIGFRENLMHLRLLEEIARDLMAGERAILLIGNQGTGKNKLADRLLQLLRCEREYMQLHRDSTVQSLTVEASLSGGAVVWRDSPLVLALTHGRVLMLDEADKAPLEVVAVLKSLLADGQMLLSDGRRVLSAAAASAGAAGDLIIHEDFRVLALANRPGFPFLGNDFFKECGSLFASHVVDNPDAVSQLEIMRSHAPSVPHQIMRRLVAAFDELRGLVRDGLLSYPFPEPSLNLP